MSERKSVSTVREHVEPGQSDPVSWEASLALLREEIEDLKATQSEFATRSWSLEMVIGVTLAFLVAVVTAVCILVDLIINIIRNQSPLPL